MGLYDMSIILNKMRRDNRALSASKNDMKTARFLR